MREGLHLSSRNALNTTVFSGECIRRKARRSKRAVFALVAALIDSDNRKALRSEIFVLQEHRTPIKTASRIKKRFAKFTNFCAMKRTQRRLKRIFLIAHMKNFHARYDCESRVI
jgi:hypothetical protein